MGVAFVLLLLTLPNLTALDAPTLAPTTSALPTDTLQAPDSGSAPAPSVPVPTAPSLAPVVTTVLATADHLLSSAPVPVPLPYVPFPDDITAWLPWQDGLPGNDTNASAAAPAPPIADGAGAPLAPGGSTQATPGRAPSGAEPLRVQGAAASGPLAPARAQAALAIGVVLALALLARFPRLQRLVGTPVAKLASRFWKRELLESERRAAIFARLHERPGLTYGELEEATGLRRGALVHHLQMMERQGLVTSRNDGARRHFYPAGTRVPVEGPAPTEAQERVLALLRERGAVAQADVADALGMTQQGASYHLLRLETQGRVARGPDRCWSLVEAQAPSPESG